MILHESCPSLARRWCFPNFWQVFLNGPFTHLDPEFEQFTPNPLCTCASYFDCPSGFAMILGLFSPCIAICQKFEQMSKAASTTPAAA